MRHPLQRSGKERECGEYYPKRVAFEATIRFVSGGNIHESFSRMDSILVVNSACQAPPPHTHYYLLFLCSAVPFCGAIRRTRLREQRASGTAHLSYKCVNASHLPPPVHPTHHGWSRIDLGASRFTCMTTLLQPDR